MKSLQQTAYYINTTVCIS